MDSVADVIALVRAHLQEIALCLGLPVLLSLIFGTRSGDGGGWFGNDCDGDGGD